MTIHKTVIQHLVIIKKQFYRIAESLILSLSDRGEPYIIFYSRAIEITAEIEVVLTKDSNFDTFSGEGIVAQNVVDLIDNLKIGETLFLQKVESACLVQGVTSVVITINGGSANLIPSYDTIIVTNLNLVEVS